MLTFQNIYQEAQEQVEDDSAATLTLLKRGINQGAKKFGAILNRTWRTTEKTFSIVASQQYYQMPEDCIRAKSITVTISSVAYPLKEIADEDIWRQLNERVETSSVPEFFYIRGNDEFGIWPIPVASVSSAGLLNYERRMRDMSQADYTTGTITVTANSAAVVGSGTTFTQLMVGRSLRVDDASGDGMWYKIDSYTDATHITLENTYGGLTASGLSYTIGELPDIPEEFHESLVDYACYRYYRRRRDIQLARDMKGAFDEAVVECINDYSSSTSSQYIKPVRPNYGYVHKRRDYTVT